VFEKSDLDELWRKCVSLFVLKKNLMRGGTQLLFVIEDEEEEEKKKVPRMILMESQQRKIEEKFSFRVLVPKKKGPHKTLPSPSSSQQERTTKRALEGVRVCVCVCVDLESKQHIHTQTERNGAKLVVWWRRPRRE
jgi:hypothetical protein